MTCKIVRHTKFMQYNIKRLIKNQTALVEYIL